MNKISLGLAASLLTLLIVPTAQAETGTGPAGLGPVKQITTDEGVACAINASDQLRCWGRGIAGQEKVPADLGTVSQAALSFWAACAIKTNGTLRCWGQHPSMDPSPSVPGNLGSVKKVAIGNAAICVIKADDTARCWSDNRQTVSTTTMTPPANLGTVKQVSVGIDSACAVTTADVVRCWGDRYATGAKVPTGLGSVKSISSAGEGTCVLTSSNLMRCWGSEVPTVPSNLGTVHAALAGFGSACAIKSDDTVRCWYGKSWQGGGLAVPTTLGTVKQLAAANGHTDCAIKTDDSAYCWGSDFAGQLTGRPGLGIYDIPGPPRLKSRTMTVPANLWKWSNGPISSVAYKWQRISHKDFQNGYARWRDTPGADQLSYTAKPSDKGYNIRACAKATNASGVSDWECSLSRGPFR